MLFKRRTFIGTAGLVGVVVALVMSDLAAAQQRDARDVVVLTRGPVHEAFAEPVRTGGEPGVVVEVRPPRPLDELPAPVRPISENTRWIPGYWHWDDELEEYIWVSGIWRVVRRDLRWIPGYWAGRDDGYQWVSGFWLPADAPSLRYLPYPPPTGDRGPTEAAPGPDYFWVPGYWSYERGRYRWVDGYWAEHQAGWVWVPTRHIWTPSGSILAPGYWDYPLEQRGLLFAPVHFRTAIYERPQFIFVPTTLIDVAVLVPHLFVRARYHHYYFGDYYADRYARLGYLPWFVAAGRPRWYDPIFVYQHWDRRRIDPDWLQRVHAQYLYYLENEAVRPPRTFEEQRELARRERIDPIGFLLGVATDTALGDPRLGRQIVQIDRSRREAARRAAQTYRQLEEGRAQVEVEEAQAVPPRQARVPDVPQDEQPAEIEVEPAPLLEVELPEPAPVNLDELEPVPADNIEEPPVQPPAQQPERPPTREPPDQPPAEQPPVEEPPRQPPAQPPNQPPVQEPDDAAPDERRRPQEREARQPPAGQPPVTRPPQRPNRRAPHRATPMREGRPVPATPDEMQRRHRATERPPAADERREPTPPMRRRPLTPSGSRPGQRPAAEPRVEQRDEPRPDPQGEPPDKRDAEEDDDDSPRD